MTDAPDPAAIAASPIVRRILEAARRFDALPKAEQENLNAQIAWLGPHGCPRNQGAADYGNRCPASNDFPKWGILGTEKDNEMSDETRAHALRLKRLHLELRERGDELSLLAARRIEYLLNRTAVHLGYTDQPTGERVDLYAPSNRCLALAGDRPLALQIVGRHFREASSEFEDISIFSRKDAEPED